VVKPAKPPSDDGAQGGLVRFRVEQAGLYRISLASGHWVDVIAHDEAVVSRDHQGARGCEPLHKIVEFDLPAGSELVLQLSGARDTAVRVAITPVKREPG
jgi:hypothetical protein